MTYPFRFVSDRPQVYLDFLFVAFQSWRCEFHKVKIEIQHKNYQKFTVPHPERACSTNRFGYKKCKTKTTSKDMQRLHCATAKVTSATLLRLFTYPNFCNCIAASPARHLNIENVYICSVYCACIWIEWDKASVFHAFGTPLSEASTFKRLLQELQKLQKILARLCLGIAQFPAIDLVQSLK